MNQKENNTINLGILIRMVGLVDRRAEIHLLKVTRLQVLAGVIHLVVEIHSKTFCEALAVEEDFMLTRLAKMLQREYPFHSWKLAKGLQKLLDTEECPSALRVVGAELVQILLQERVLSAMVLVKLFSHVEVFKWLPLVPCVVERENTLLQKISAPNVEGMGEQQITKIWR
jgi:hypothetical protein